MALRRVSRAAIDNVIQIPVLDTDEDQEIWRSLSMCSRAAQEALVTCSEMVDHFDAELMRTAQQHKGCVAHWSPSRGHAALVRGWK